MEKEKRNVILLHLVIILFAIPTLAPFVLVFNNSFRTNSEMNRNPFALPKYLKGCVGAMGKMVTAPGEELPVMDKDKNVYQLKPASAVVFYVKEATQGYGKAWKEIRPYILNSIFVCLATAFLVLILASITAYILSRYRFPGHKVIFFYFIATMMFPGVLTLVPSFLLVKKLGLLNSYWVLILPFVAGGQVFAIFVFKSFFDGLPEDLFEAARIDGAGHMQLYWNVVLPLSKPVMSVILIMNIMGSWNNFLWPFIANTDSKYHLIASGLFILARSETASDGMLMSAAFVLSSIPLLILFIYATKPFVQGMTSGAFKA